jgi:CubicO group peptidase (beta-lactamase class C family)
VTTPFEPFARLLAAHQPAHQPASVSVAALLTPTADPQVATTPGDTPYTLYQAASTSKAVAALAALILVDQGKLGLDTSVSTYLKTWKPTERSGLTLRHLLCHAGAVNIASFPGYPKSAPLPTMAQILDGQPPSASAPVRVTDKPMLAYRYSGGGYQIVQRLLEDVSGQPMDKLVTDLVLRPLRMFNAQYLQPDLEEAAHGFVGGSQLPGGWYVYPELSAAGLWCTPTDLARFAAGIQLAVAGMPGAILSQKLAGEMVTEQVRGSGWGLGLELAGTGAGKCFGHRGRNRGYVCEFSATVALGPAIAVMTGTDQGAMIIHDVLPAVRGLLKWPDPAACIPSPTRPGPPPPTPGEEAQMAAAVAGDYLVTAGTAGIPKGTKLSLAGTGWNWSLTIGTRPPVPLEVLSDQSLCSPDVDPVRVVFTIAHPVTLTVTLPGPASLAATHT